jgi:DNA-binding MurR/RpiR family transcriptional regulator
MFRQRIQKLYASLPPSHQRLANFILDYYRQAAFMSTNQIGDQLGMDAATVVRFAQRLGYQGYPHLREDMRQAVERDLHVSNEQTSPVPDEVEDVNQAVLRSLQNHIEALQVLCTVLAQQPVEDALDQILTARHVYIMGEGISRRVADLFVNGLRALGLQACLVESDLGNALVHALNMKKDDLFVGVVCTAFCPNVIRMVRAVKREGVPTLGLVGAHAWPFTRLADTVLVAPTPQPAIFTHFGVMTALVKALLEALIGQSGDWAASRAARIDRITQALLHDEFDLGENVLHDVISRYAKSNGNGENGSSQGEDSVS